jgi:hypothetical protein
MFSKLYYFRNFPLLKNIAAMHPRMRIYIRAITVLCQSQSYDVKKEYIFAVRDMCIRHKEGGREGSGGMEGSGGRGF